MKNKTKEEMIWRLLILDISGVYTQIYDEIFGNNADTLDYLLNLYSNRSKYLCILLDK